MIFQMRRPAIIACLFLTGACLKAQDVVAPTPDKVGSSRGEDWAGYNVVDSFETGYRFVSTAGNVNTYRSTENFGNGVRLLSSYLTVNSKTGHGRLFDEIVLTTEGLGGDPYSNVKLRVQKNRVYEYTLLWRHSNYFNPGLVTDGGAGEHLLNTSNNLQDQDLTLFPQSRIRPYFGYSRSTQSGPGISTVLLFQPTGQFDPNGNVFPVFANVQIVQNDYRLGAEVNFAGFTLNLLHGWEDFKDDSGDSFSGTNTGDGFSPNAVLNLFGRTQPDHGTSPYWRGTLFRNNDLFQLNARFTYTGGQRAFVANETALGTNQFGAAANQQIITLGDASRPVTTGNLTVSLFPSKQFAITEQFSIYNIRTVGNSAYLQFNDATQVGNLLYYQYLGIRTIASETDVLYHAKSWLDVHGGYEFSERRIGSSTNWLSSVPRPQIRTFR